MPNIESVKKDVIKSRKNRLRNLDAKSAVKTFVKKARAAMTESKVDAQAVGLAVRAACQAIDKSAERGIIHKNQASRRKSRLMKHAHRSIQSAVVAKPRARSTTSRQSKHQ